MRRTLAKLGPSAVVLADRATSPDHQHAIAAQLAAHDPIVPHHGRHGGRRRARLRRMCCPIAAANVATQLVPRLRAALRVRALHAAVLRRLEELGERDDAPEFPQHDPLDDATVLVAGRGRNYPALTVAVGERMGLIGALSLDTARSYLGARDIDGVVIGDGFNRSMVEDFMDELVRRSALARPAGDRAARRARSEPRAHAERGSPRRRPADDRRAHAAARAPACLLGAAQARDRLARPEGHARARIPA